MSNIEPLEPTILYEDADIAVINKPAGLVVHSDGRTAEPTLADWVVKTWPSAAEAGEPIVQSNGEKINRPGIVHRLDRDTSGVMLVAKTARGYEHLKKQFQARTVAKKYLALVHGTFEDNYGIIDRPIGRSVSDFRKKSASRGAEGELRPAMTWYVVKGKTVIESDGQKYPISLIEAEPKTGRTHQIRVHMQAVHHPVVCDPLYGAGKPCVMDFGRTALHARFISWNSMDGTRMKAEAPLPEDFKDALQKHFKGVVLA
ncbi:MAG: RluA family pseudouridine synthase [Patescibacteria group bacterium]|nr:RluA family pseudouridine synthase [Patescibacteria group bacterium]